MPQDGRYPPRGVSTGLSSLGGPFVRVLVGRVLERLDAGDHDAILLEPVLAERGTDAEEFSFHRAKRIEPGHEA